MDRAEGENERALFVICCRLSAIKSSPLGRYPIYGEVLKGPLQDLHCHKLLKVLAQLFEVGPCRGLQGEPALSAPITGAWTI